MLERIRCIVDIKNRTTKHLQHFFQRKILLRGLLRGERTIREKIRNPNEISCKAKFCEFQSQNRCNDSNQ